ncbi:MAG: hypothetical protein SEPTF4163_006161 [Sporothrix epigloea]
MASVDSLADSPADPVEVALNSPAPANLIPRDSLEPVSTAVAPQPTMDAAAAAAAVAASAAAAVAAARSAKRLRSPTLYTSVAGDFATHGGHPYEDGEASPRKLARLASSDSRFDDNSAPVEEFSVDPQLADHQAHEAHEAREAHETHDVAQTALSVLRGAEALMSQRVAEAAAAAEAATRETIGTAAATEAKATENTETDDGHDTDETTIQQVSPPSNSGVTTDVSAPSASLAAAAAVAAAAAAAAVSSSEATASSRDITGADQTDVDSEATRRYQSQQSFQQQHLPQQHHLDHSHQEASSFHPAAVSFPRVPDVPPASSTADSPRLPPPIQFSAVSDIPELTHRLPSSANKRHKCPYCDTEFTRHHNLKSHLLTHSQEKPYVCQGCDMRFRRLHDLKRHSKLHSGDKPHICARCDRKFARRDALARHSKGAGGCAGRRSSSGVFGSNVLGSGDDSFDGHSSLMDTTAGADDSAMSGIEYGVTNTSTTTGGEDERRRMSLPSMKAEGMHGRAAGDSHANTTDTSFGTQHARTYPPASSLQRPSSGVYPLHVGAGGSVSSAGVGTASTAPSTEETATSSAHTATTGASLFSQHGIAESPKPLSPVAQQNGAGLQSALVRPGSNGLPGMSNISSSENGMWTYIQSLEDKLKAQDEWIQHQEERLAQVMEEKLSLESQVESLKRSLASATVTTALDVPEAHDGPVKIPAAPASADRTPVVEETIAVDATEPKALLP